MSLAMVAVAMLVTTSPANAGKFVDRVIGDTSTGTTGGLFNSPEEVAVNSTGAGGVAPGTFYVADRLNHRIQRFSPAGVFELAWGADVDMPAGGSDLEICTVAANCKAGVAGAGNGTAAGNGALNQPHGVTVDGDTGKVYVSAPSTRQISVYDADGNFERAFGFDVAASGPGDTGTGFEICVQADGDICKLGTAGSGVGQLASTNVAGGSDIVITPPDANAATGNVYYADTNNSRVSVYELDGTDPSSFGTTADYITNFPRDLAIDSSGIVYSSNRAAGNVNEVKRYDTAGAGFLAPIDPDALAADGVPSNQGTSGLSVDSATGNLLVARDTASAGVLEISDPATAPAFVDRHLTTVNPSGVAANPATGEILEFLNHRVLILDDDGAIPANVTLGAVTDVTEQGATLNATIESVATGLSTDYRFQVSINGVDWITFGTAGTVPDGATDDVSTTATDLLPNTPYRLRVVANRTLGNPDVASAEGSFITDAVPPTIVSSGVESIDTHSARLFGYVNPNSSHTTYRFEWGTRPDALVNRVPTPNGALGASPASVFVAETIPDLDPDTTYHYRLLAINAAGASATATGSFTTRSEPLGERGWEMVSPVDKDPNAYVQDYLTPAEISYQISPSGDNVFYTLSHGVEGATVGAGGRYLAGRGAAGWSSEQMWPALTGDLFGLGWTAQYKFLSQDLSCGVLQSPQPLTPDASRVAELNLFRRDGDGSYEWLTTEPLNAASVSERGTFDAAPGASSDCANVVFETTYRFDGVNDSGVYRSQGGALSDVAVRPDGSSAPSAGVGSSSLGTVRWSAKNAVSLDASHVYFSAISNGGNPPGTGDDSGNFALYLHREGQPSIKVSGSETATVNRRAVFQIASRDGGRVAFLANYGLTATSSSGPVATNCTSPPPQPCALYVYDVASDSMVDVSATADGANTNGAVVGGVLGASDDLSRIYFAAQGQLVPGEGRTYAENIENGANSADATFNVYMHSEGEGLTYVGLVTGHNINSRVNGNVTVTATFRTAQVTPDGRSLLFASAVDNVGYDNAGINQAYLFSADSGEVACVSCRRDGEPPVLADLDLAPAGAPSHTDEDLAQPVVFRNDIKFMSEDRMVSTDGSRVVFAVHDALTADAVEGNQNIYLWDRGTLTLLDSGPAAAVPIYFLENFRDRTPYVVGMSPSGDDVFIRTVSGLVSQDTDGVKDLYDFRVGGGFPEPVAPPVPCAVLADGCQGGGAATAGSEAVSDAPGGSNADFAERRTIALSGLSRAARRRAARRGVIVLRARTSSAGRIRAVARARVGGRRGRARVRSVARDVARTRTGGRVVLRLRLSQAARRTLRASGRLRLAVRVSMPGARSRSAAMVLRRTGTRRATSSHRRAER